ncbi:GNAT family N-acetyltransferase [Parabacteroides sp. FAFU027]|uniref:GNAT family N-acetyltransferase n=1 Tax=Parabacteroides sp. FAFU027 TaxID=2922715 RepID=UPI001FB037AC|nr:GNAT family N-acetyltransferase [Parabacteroides sp. FAFU027]
MKIIDITPENQHHYFCCLEEWSDDIKEAGDFKQKWYEKMKDKGIRVKYAVDDHGIIGGMIQYIPIEHSMFEGKNLYVVLCIWVHGHKQGRGDYRHRGMGKALILAAEEDCRELGADGLVTWGLILPVFMRASWFKRQGHKVVDKYGMMRLLWKPFNEDAIAPKFIRPQKLPAKGSGKVNVTLFRNGWCPVMTLAYERVKRASEEFPGKIEIVEYDTTNREIVNEWGISDALYIDGKEVRTGPPPSFEKIRRKVARRVRKL